MLREQQLHAQDPDRPRLYACMKAGMSCRQRIAGEHTVRIDMRLLEAGAPEALATAGSGKFALRMQFYWRGDNDRLTDYGGWVSRVDKKNQMPGTSAPTLAQAWSGPLDLLGAVSGVPELADLAVQTITVEQKATFDSLRGNVRNHDLVLRAGTRAGEAVIVCVEAKAGESLGDPVSGQRQHAETALTKNPRSKAVQRLDHLLARYCRYPADDPRTDALQYQLLTGWAGTLADAVGHQHAVFAVHEFRTDQRPEDKTGHNRAALDRFAEMVLGCELPDGGPPWCMRVPDVDGIESNLYVAHVVTDLRGVRITGVPAS